MRFFLIIITIIGISISGFFLKQTLKNPQASLEKVTIGSGQELISSILWIAQEKGFFKEEDIEVELKPYASGKLALKEMLNDEVRVAASSEVPIMVHFFERKDFSIIATVGQSSNELKIVARKDADIQVPADLKGKRIATQKNSAVHFFMHNFLIFNEILETELDISFMPAQELIPALLNGKIDAFSMQEPFVQQAKNKLGNNCIVFEAPGIYTKTYNLIAQNRFIKEKPHIVKKIVRAILKTKQFMHNNKSESIEIIAGLFNLNNVDLTNQWDDFVFNVSLEKTLLVTLEDEGRWMITQNFTQEKKIPNYLRNIYFDALEQEKPEAINIIH